MWSAREALLHKAAGGPVVLQLVRAHRVLFEPRVILEAAPQVPSPLLPALYRVLLSLSTKGLRYQDVSELALRADRPFTHRLEDTPVLCLS